MKKALTLLVTLVVMTFMVICVGCGSNNEPVAQQPVAIMSPVPQDDAHAKLERQKNVALQHFQEFRVAGTFNAGVKALNSMELALGSVGLTNADIPIRETEITAHLWDLAHRKPAAKKQQVQPVMAHKIKQAKQYRK